MYYLPDINECELNPCPTVEECQNTPGNFTCTQDTTIATTSLFAHSQAIRYLLAVADELAIVTTMLQVSTLLGARWNVS
ncbi:hypothetical protein ANCDUO_24239 [Ancylostoma duodenale]|uniref:EGF-like calcium-binding domain-containing protein n=1 Tax=Ancylostoma duodenale TaxID=51022 RepID=A0A0C2C7S6_9BILA|nr:hypothetical protein ANCDUO_24239 [Ancylostoma duodenale]